MFDEYRAELPPVGEQQTAPTIIARANDYQHMIGIDAGDYQTPEHDFLTSLHNGAFEKAYVAGKEFKQDRFQREADAIVTGAIPTFDAYRSRVRSDYDDVMEAINASMSVKEDVLNRNMPKGSEIAKIVMGAPFAEKLSILLALDALDFATVRLFGYDVLGIPPEVRDRLDADFAVKNVTAKTRANAAPRAATLFDPVPFDPDLKDLRDKAEKYVSALNDRKKQIGRKKQLISATIAMLAAGVDRNADEVASRVLR